MLRYMAILINFTQKVFISNFSHNRFLYTNIIN
jgi:hypothetical protein